MNRHYSHIFLLIGLCFFFTEGLASRKVDIWVLFKDKPLLKKNTLSKKTLYRRKINGFEHLGYGDFPVSDEYINRIQALGATLRHRVKVLNAASFRVDTTLLRVIVQQPFVSAIKPVKSFTKSPLPGTLKKSAQTTTADSVYGESAPYLSLVNIPQAHTFISKTTKTMPGEGIIIALFDSGFRLGHEAFDYIRDNNAVIGDSDFVDRDSDVSDVDIDGNSHGAMTLSLIGGYLPGRFIGTAPGAQFLLARTENDFSETHTEEDNWIAALEWAENNGAHIVSSSLGYRYGFSDEPKDYPFSAMDGESTLISRAADSLAQRGLIIVNSIGNEGAARTLNAPSDAAHVVTVGSVDKSGAISWFSSRGPTADGRIKPDVCAPGQSLVVPNPTTRSSFLSSSGTSFSTPVTAGICALIKQVFPDSSADAVRGILYRSCYPGLSQVVRDNNYGWGIVDAYAACRNNYSVQLTIQGTNSGPIANVVVRDSLSGDTLAVSDSSGVAFFAVDPDSLSRAYRLTVPGSGGFEQFVTIDTVPNRKEISFVSRITVISESSASPPVVDGLIFWRPPSENQFSRTPIHASGTTAIPFFSQSACEIFVRAKGFSPTDTMFISPGLAQCSLTVTMEPIGISDLLLVPNIVRSVASNPYIHVTFTAGERRSPFRAVVRSVDGNSLWEFNEYFGNYEIVELDITCQTATGKSFSPGTYFFIATYGGKRKVLKFFIIG